ncbi:MAG TPA: hypothetical protein DIW21_00455 [Enterococcus sp.]|nr:hypothetical protein [Enterococcus sp.]
MKGKLYWFVALIGGCALFLLSPLYGTYAYFTDTNTIDTALTLKLLSIKTNDVTITTNKLNTTVTGDVTATVSGFNGEVNLSLADDAAKWEDYFSIELPTLTNGQSQQIKVTKKKNLPASYNGALTLTIHYTVKLSDGNDVIVGSSTLLIKDTEDTSEEWPSDDKFQNNYFISQKIYFTTDTNGYYQQVNDGVIYIKYTGTLSNANIEKLKTGFTLDVSGTKYQLDVDIKVFAGKGFKVVLKKLKKSTVVNGDSLYLHMDGIKNDLTYIGFGRFAFRFLLNSDFAFNKSGVKLDTSIYTRSTGVTLNYATQEDSGSVKTLATLSNLSNYATWQVSDTNNFTITAQSDTSVTIKQNSSSGGKTAMLQLVSKSDNKTVLFERQIVSVNEEKIQSVYESLESQVGVTDEKTFNDGESKISFTLKYQSDGITVNNGEYSIPVYVKFSKSGLIAVNLSTFSVVSKNSDFSIDKSQISFSKDTNYMKFIIKASKLGVFAFQIFADSESSNDNVALTYYKNIQISTSVSSRIAAMNKSISESTDEEVINSSERTTGMTDASTSSKGTGEDAATTSSREFTAETNASSEEVQTTTEQATTSKSSEETTSDPSTTSTTTDDTTETTTSSEETVASQ